MQSPADYLRGQPEIYHLEFKWYEYKSQNLGLWFLRAFYNSAISKGMFLFQSITSVGVSNDTLKDLTHIPL